MNRKRTSFKHDYEDTKRLVPRKSLRQSSRRRTRCDSSLDSDEGSSDFDKTSNVDKQSTYEFFSEQLRKVETSMVEQHEHVLSLFKHKRSDNKHSLERRVDTLLEENAVLKTELHQLKRSSGDVGFAVARHVGDSCILGQDMLPPVWGCKGSAARPPTPGEILPPNDPCPPKLSLTDVSGDEASPILPTVMTRQLTKSSIGDAEKQEEEARTCNFELHEMWKAAARHKRLNGQTNFNPAGVSWNFTELNTMAIGDDFEHNDESEELGGQVAITTTSCLRHVMVHPNNSIKGMWDIGSLFLVLYDMITIPLGVFDTEPTHFEKFMSWVTRMFWSMDMPLAFFAGYITAKGAIEMRPKQIALRYMKSWLILDVLVVGIDWMEIVFDAAAEQLGFARIGKASRVFRILRMIRLLRLARMKEVLNLLIERLDSEKLVILLDITKLFIIMLGFGHLVACLWYWVGTQGERNWTKKNDYDMEAVPMQYMMAMRWAISQFAGGMDEVTPNSLFEHCFALVIFLIAFWSGAVFLGILTSSMTQLYIIGSTQTQQLTVLRRYLTQNGISKNLSLRVQRNAQHSMAERETAMPEAAVELITVVSEPLRVELHYEMYAHVLALHPFFKRYIAECPHVMRKVCHGAVSMAPVSVGDVIFNVGEIPAAPKMFIISKGELAYYSDGGKKSTLGPGDWLCEFVIWVPWVHRGMLTTVSDTMIHAIDAKEFQLIVSSFEHVGFDPRSYAADFLDMLNSTPGPEVTDMCLPDQQQLKVGTCAEEEVEDKDSVEQVEEKSFQNNLSVVEATKRFKTMSSALFGLGESKKRNSVSSFQEELEPEEESGEEQDSQEVDMQERNVESEDDMRSSGGDDCKRASECRRKKEQFNSELTAHRSGNQDNIDTKVAADVEDSNDGVKREESLDSICVVKKVGLPNAQVKPINTTWTVCLIDEEEI